MSQAAPGRTTLTAALVAALGLGVGTMGTLVWHVEKPAKISMPVEVMGAQSATREVSFTLSGAPERLRLFTHGVTYESKCGVRLNAGPWLLLTNDTAQAENARVAAYGGIGGPAASFWVSVPVSSLGQPADGLNSLSFRFEQTDGASSGFRVLAFNFQDEAGKDLIPTTQFVGTRTKTVDGDPKQWAVTNTDPALIEQGRNVWYHAALRSSSRADALPITAHCADCHARDGRDLQYFNYSNLAISERVVFHGLSASDGDAVAAYIRSLPGPRPGRPWNPPYQPGPGLDKKPAAEWSAGAGLGWVLEKDSDTLPYLFPKGVTASTSSTLNLRELPLSFQFPDWNHWLPRVHPKDAFGDQWEASAVRKDYDGAGSGKALLNLRQWFAARKALDTQDANALYRWEEDWRAFMASVTPKTAAGRDCGFHEALYSAKLWQLTKTWELTQEFALESRPSTVFAGSPAPEPRSWIHALMFNTAPHKLGIPDADPGINGHGVYLNNAWYGLQTILYAGNRRGNNNFPVDWGYDLSHAAGSAAVTPNAARLTALVLKGMQEADNGKGLDLYAGWHPAWLADPVKLVAGRSDRMWSEVSPERRNEVVEAVVSAYLAKCKTFSPEAYYKTGIASASETPNPNDNGGAGAWVNRMWTLSSVMRAWGCRASVTDELCDWCATVWPKGQWSKLKG